MKQNHQQNGDATQRLYVLAILHAPLRAERR